MSGALIVALLREAKREFGSPSTWDCDSVALWLRRRVRDIRDGQDAVPNPLKLVSSRQREPGDDDE